MQPAVSVIMPVFNRRQVLQRAIQSVSNQLFADWELIIVDDGSTDGSIDSIDTSDPRIKILRQSNQGANVARNAGIDVSRGRYIAFLDSDDEWMPHFLLLTFEFLENNPQEAFVATEFLESTRDSAPLIQDLHVIRHSHVELAKTVRSSALDLPEGTTDDYLRIYKTRESLGNWWSSIADRIPNAPLEANCYRGHIGEAYRWGHLHALWCLLIRREAVQAVGPIAVNRRSCTDLKFLVDLCRRYRANMIAVPSVIKHELYGPQIGNVAGHLSSGTGYATFNKNYSALFAELFVNRFPKDKEIATLYGLLCLKTGMVTLDYGERSEAIRYFHLASDHLSSPLSPRILAVIARLSPTTRIGAALTRLYARIEQQIKLRNSQDEAASIPSP